MPRSRRPSRSSRPPSRSRPSRAETDAPQTPVAKACGKLTTLFERDKCPTLVRGKFDPARCEKDLSGGIQGVSAESFATFIDCLGTADQCSAIDTCGQKLTAEVSGGDGGRTCGEVGIGAVSLSADEASKRYGQGVTQLSKVPTTKEKPIEVCGVAAQHAWLMATRCDDGSAPFKSRGDAAGARSGSRGIGGRCKSTIDLYQVTCPEKTYDVFMDLYMCGPGESI